MIRFIFFCSKLNKISISVNFRCHDRSNSTARKFDFISRKNIMSEDRVILYKNGNEFYKYCAATCSICEKKSLYFCILCLTFNTQIDPPPSFCAQHSQQFLSDEVDLSSFLCAPRQYDVPIKTCGRLCAAHGAAINIQFPGLLMLLNQIDNLICVEKKE